MIDPDNTTPEQVEAGHAMASECIAAKPENRALALARSALESILEQVAALKAAEEAGDSDAQDAAEEDIRSSIYALEVRSDWHSPGERAPAGEFRLTLAGGGPALQMVGDVEDGEPGGNVRLQYQDWGTPWTDYRNPPGAREALTRFAACFYFGEG